MLVYMALVALVLWGAGREVAAWYWEVLSAAQSVSPGETPVFLPMPEGVGRVVGLMLLVMMLSGGLYAIGFGQVALGGRSAPGALADAAAGTLKNALPLLGLAGLGLVALMLASSAVVRAGAGRLLAGSMAHARV